MAKTTAGKTTNGLICKADRNGSVTTAVRPPRPRPSGSSPADPLVPFQMWKIRRSTIDTLREGALEKGWSSAALVRKLLDEWAAKRRARRGAGAGSKVA